MSVCKNRPRRGGGGGSYLVHGLWQLVAWMSEYCFTSLSAQSWQYRDRRKPEAGNMPYSYFEWLQEFFIVHSTIGSTEHSKPMNSLEHCISTTTMANIRPDWDSNLVPPGYKLLSIRINHRDQTTIVLYVVLRAINKTSGDNKKEPLKPHHQ